MKNVKKAFISWSGVKSKLYGDFIKELLKDVFDSKLDVFFSPKDIQKGEDWLNKLNTKIKEADICIIIITKDSLNSMWLNYEAGAIAFNQNSANNKLICPILVDIDELDRKSPLNSSQLIKNNKEDLFDLFSSVNNTLVTGKKLKLPHLKSIFESSYTSRISDLTIDDATENISLLNPYPTDIVEMKKKSLFLASPMAAAKLYTETRDETLRVKEALYKCCGVKEIYYPGEHIPSTGVFEGKEKALKKDFQKLKSAEFCVFIYPEKAVTSILLEIGYVIALNKKTIVFVRDRKDLPFMLELADHCVPRLKIYVFDTYDDIVTKCEQEGENLLATFK